MSNATNGTGESGEKRLLGTAAGPVAMPEDDEAPPGAGNWYLGPCVQRKGILYPRWGKTIIPVEGIIMGIYGVLYEGDQALPGSVEAIKRLKAAGVQVRFCSNCSTKTQSGLSKFLQDIGFEGIKQSDLFLPTPVVVKELRDRGLRPFIIADPDVMPDFQSIDQQNPNCVVLGDAKDQFMYERVNKAFRILKDSEKPILITMGRSIVKESDTPVRVQTGQGCCSFRRFYKDNKGLDLDVGPYAKLLEYACDIEAEVIGKPNKSYYEAVLKTMDCDAEAAIMIGDDIEADVQGAKELNMRAVMVRTGKYRREKDEPHKTIQPDGYVDNLLVAADLFLKHRT